MLRTRRWQHNKLNSGRAWFQYPQCISNSCLDIELAAVVPTVTLLPSGGWWGVSKAIQRITCWLSLCWRELQATLQGIKDCLAPTMQQDVIESLSKLRRNCILPIDHAFHLHGKLLSFIWKAILKFTAEYSGSIWNSFDWHLNILLIQTMKQHFIYLLGTIWRHAFIAEYWTVWQYLAASICSKPKETYQLRDWKDVGSHNSNMLGKRNFSHPDNVLLQVHTLLALCIFLNTHTSIGSIISCKMRPLAVLQLILSPACIPRPVWAAALTPLCWNVSKACFLCKNTMEM